MTMIKIVIPANNKKACEVFGRALIELSGTEAGEGVTMGAEKTYPSAEVHDITAEVKIETPDTTTDENTLDSAGLPWDERIHSRGKTINADGTWRIMRRPKHHANEETWEQYVSMILAELGEATAETVNNVTTAETAFSNSNNQQETPPPLVDPVEEITFPALMTLITSNADKIKINDVLEIIRKPAYGLTALAELTTTRPELTPHVYADIQAFINEH